MFGHTNESPLFLIIYHLQAVRRDFLLSIQAFLNLVGKKKHATKTLAIINDTSNTTTDNNLILNGFSISVLFDKLEFFVFMRGLF